MRRQYQNHNPRPGPVYAGGGYTPINEALLWLFLSTSWKSRWVYAKEEPGMAISISKKMIDHLINPDKSLEPAADFITSNGSCLVSRPCGRVQPL